MSTPVSSDPIVLSAARWFWWIAGLSLVNLVMNLNGSDTNFVIGLAMTSLISGMFAGTVPVALALAGVIIGFYVWMGWQGQRGKLWAFYAGLAVYAVDALIYARFEDWMPVAFHAFALYCIGKGVMRLRALGSAPAEAA